MHTKSSRMQIQKMAARAFSLLMVLAFLAAALPQPAQAAPEATCAKNHVVVSGDTLSKLALTYDVSEQEIAAANNLQSPYTLIIGQSICIPGTTTTTTTTTTGSTTTSSAKNSIQITVTDRRLVVKLSGFSSNSNYFIRIGDNNPRSSRPWRRLGKINVAKAGTASKSFQLPQSFRSGTFVLCLKNMRNDAVYCKRYLPADFTRIDPNAPVSE